MPASLNNARRGVDRTWNGSHRSRRRLATPAGAPGGDLAHLATQQGRKIVLHRGNHLFWRDEPFGCAYLIQAGSVKTYNVDLAGDERIRAFHFPGELLGLDGIADGSHNAHAEALEASMVYALPSDPLLQFAAKSAPLQLALLRCLSREYDAAVRHGGDFTAEQRVAAFVLELSERAAGADGSGYVRASMTRREMGNYLRLATATVCRTLAAMQAGGVLRNDSKRIDIIDRGRLQELAEPVVSS